MLPRKQANIQRSRVRAACSTRYSSAEWHNSPTASFKDAKTRQRFQDGGSEEDLSSFFMLIMHISPPPNTLGFIIRFKSRIGGLGASLLDCDLRWITSALVHPDAPLIPFKKRKKSCLLIHSKCQFLPNKSLSLFFFHANPLLMDICSLHSLVVSFLLLVSIECVLFWPSGGMPHIARAEGDKMNNVLCEKRRSQKKPPHIHSASLFSLF